MQCIICHSEDITRRVVQEEIPLGDDLVRVPVEVLVCSACGERYYDRRTVRYLEEVERKLKAGELNLRSSGRLLVCDPA